jgi:hypothetical protein
MRMYFCSYFKIIFCFSVISKNFPIHSPETLQFYQVCAVALTSQIYPLLSPPKLKAHASNRVCNALALLQCVASHAETRTLFLNGAPSRRRLSAALSSLLMLLSAHTPLPVPVPEHSEQDAAVRVPAPDQPRRHRCPC